MLRRPIPKGSKIQDDLFYKNSRIFDKDFSGGRGGGLNLHFSRPSCNKYTMFLIFSLLLCRKKCNQHLQSYITIRRSNSSQPQIEMTKVCISSPWLYNYCKIYVRYLFYYAKVIYNLQFIDVLSIINRDLMICFCIIGQDFIPLNNSGFNYEVYQYIAQFRQK